MFFLHLILLIFPNVANGLSCIGIDVILEVSYENLTQSVLEKKLDELILPNSVDYGQCGMEVVIDYKNKLLIIEFDANKVNTNNHKSDNYFQLYTNFTFVPVRTHRSQFYKTCSLEDYCDRKFLINKRAWWSFIEQINHMPLEIILYESIENQSPQNVYRCLNNKEVIKCPSKICSAYKERDAEFSNACISRINAAISLITVIEIDTETCTQSLHFIQYNCRYDMCNDRAEVENVYAKIHQYYELSPFLRPTNVNNIKRKTRSILCSHQLQNTANATSLMTKKSTENDIRQTSIPRPIRNATMTSGSITILMNISKVKNIFLVLIIIISLWYN
ncbi:hypothetical protein I4U23_017012 [Adineta vaga]|nr:hypothetical protein I4U23_017012 [Adineta vaga]